MDSAGLSSYFKFSTVNWPDMWSAAWQTLWITVASMVAVTVLGIILGLLLYETQDSHNWFLRLVNLLVSLFVNVFRSIPFIILIVLLLPITKNLVGTIIGARAALPSLIISAAPFYARLVQIAFREIDPGVIEAAHAMGSTEWQIVRKVLIPESLPALVSGVTVTTIALIGYTAMAGAIGAGGLGQLAYNDGFQVGNNAITLMATVIIVIIVFFFQFIGDFAVKRIDKRTGL